MKIIFDDFDNGGHSKKELAVSILSALEIANDHPDRNLSEEDQRMLLNLAINLLKEE